MTRGEPGAAEVEAAAVRLAPVVRRTELELSPRLSATVGAPVHLKRENRQITRSYKVRGAYHLISGLTEQDRSRGVVCASAGNHGQGVAWSCARLGIEGRVYVPGSTPGRSVSASWPWGGAGRAGGGRKHLRRRGGRGA
ncbi:pyridoxal-phosphate dependent enzyme [Nocardioides houyundeii]|uniref:pyridoxal-phosphate dependent enzyme n=1 Tax=Nocardioides houyundeii TaxID=2045452 RepID=UPI0024111527|nr:pyridoxal-phosphate dependent enzyme [Nocardioides houyundeii]